MSIMEELACSFMPSLEELASTHLFAKEGLPSYLFESIKEQALLRTVLVELKAAG